MDRQDRQINGETCRQTYGQVYRQIVDRWTDCISREWIDEQMDILWTDNWSAGQTTHGQTAVHMDI